MTANYDTVLDCDSMSDNNMNDYLPESVRIQVIMASLYFQERSDKAVLLSLGPDFSSIGPCLVSSISLSRP